MDKTVSWVLQVLDRQEADIPIPESLGRVLVTGAAGSIGTSIRDAVMRISDEVLLTDTSYKDGSPEMRLDVTDDAEVTRVFKEFRPEVVFHLAGAKHAPLGEQDPYSAMIVNTVGTKNVVEAGSLVGARVVAASTCKSCDPETAYGASKLIAERMALNAQQVVVRFYNVVETSGNVFEIWSNAWESGADIEVAPCKRYFISAREAASLTLWASSAASGRYTLACARQTSMMTVVKTLYPGLRPVKIPPRRGDRLKEPRMAKSEQGVKVTKDIIRISSPHDPR